jgi:putative phosphoesterase
VKIGLISDIHADLTGLERALKFLHGRGVDKIICAGDLVEKGTDGDAVVKRIREENIPCVLGNHDEMVYGNQHWMRKFGEKDHPALKGRWLSDETLRFVMSLPRTLRFSFGEMSLLLAHGTPTSNVEYVFATNSEWMMRNVVKSAQADIVVLGHTHQAMWIKVGEQWIFNPGSTHSQEGNSCAILELPAIKYEVYNLETLKPVNVEHRIIEV